MVIKKVKINCESSLLTDYEYGELTEIGNFKKKNKGKKSK